MDRIVTPPGVLMARPCAALTDLIDDLEREDNARGPEPESSLRVIIRRPVIGGVPWV